MEKIKPCPVCYSNKLKPSHRGNGVMGPGYRSWVQYYVCQGCGVTLDKNVITYKVEEEPITPPKEVDN